jgi:hypothetical protein
MRSGVTDRAPREGGAVLWPRAMRQDPINDGKLTAGSLD